MIAIKHYDIGTIVHAETVSDDGARTLCGEDTAGDGDREILGTTSDKITCVFCIRIIVGVICLYDLKDLDVNAISKDLQSVNLIDNFAKNSNKE